jgi:hypothetical protein
MSLRKLLSHVLSVYILVVFLEWFVARWIFPPQGIVIFRLLLDVFPTMLLIVCLVLRHIKWTRMGLICIAGYCVSLIILFLSNLIHGGALSSIPGHFGVLYRFVPLTIVIGSLENHFWNFEKFRLWSTRFLYLLLALGVLEFFLRGHLRKFLIPGVSTFNLIFERTPVAFRDSATYDLTTIYINPIEYCFLVVGLYIVFLSTGTSYRKKLIVTMIALFAAYQSGSMAGFLFLLILATVSAVRMTLFSRLVLYSSAVILSLVAIITYWPYLKWYANISMEFNRLGILFSTLPNFILSSGVNILFGLGSDEAKVFFTIVNYPNVPLMIYYDQNLVGFDDVYWVALLIYNGLISVVMLFLIFFNIYQRAKKLEIENFLLVKRLIILVGFLGFINQVLEVKSFSLLLWLTFGIVINEVLRKSVKANSGREFIEQK